MRIIFQTISMGGPESEHGGPPRRNESAERLIEEAIRRTLRSVGNLEIDSEEHLFADGNGFMRLREPSTRSKHSELPLVLVAYRYEDAYDIASDTYLFRANTAQITVFSEDPRTAHPRPVLNREVEPIRMDALLSDPDSERSLRQLSAYLSRLGSALGEPTPQTLSIATEYLTSRLSLDLNTENSHLRVQLMEARIEVELLRRQIDNLTSAARMARPGLVGVMAKAVGAILLAAVGGAAGGIAQAAATPATSVRTAVVVQYSLECDALALQASGLAAQG